ncbi:MAG: hypothetical protein OXF65_11680 [Acidimicrobiaceae bacterium]|nr:hypothetical protein [Acidimicrobiaceae bacterium]
MTRIHWEEHEGMPTEEDWGHSTLAWAHAASAWGHAHDLVDNFFTEVFDAWFENL